MNFISHLVNEVLLMCKDINPLIIFYSNAIKFTHEGKVGINLYVVPEPFTITKQGSQKLLHDQSTVSSDTEKDVSNSESKHNNAPRSPAQSAVHVDQDKETRSNHEETVVWIRCDVYDTGIGIPGIFL